MGLEARLCVNNSEWDLKWPISKSKLLWQVQKVREESNKCSITDVKTFAISAFLLRTTDRLSTAWLSRAIKIGTDTEFSPHLFSVSSPGKSSFLWIKPNLLCHSSFRYIWLSEGIFHAKIYRFWTVIKQQWRIYPSLHPFTFVTKGSSTQVDS